jgi:hypothetical protein
MPRRKLTHAYGMKDCPTNEIPAVLVEHVWVLINEAPWSEKLWHVYWSDQRLTGGKAGKYFKRKREALIYARKLVRMPR